MNRHSNIALSALLVSTTSIMMAAPATAQHHGGDVYVEVFANRIVTGGLEGDTTTHDTRVYGSELGETFPNWTDEPGFDSPPGSFPTGTEVGFDVMDGLRVWNGSDFSTLATSTMTIAFGPLDVETSGGYVPGFSIPVSSNGEWHKHLEFTLNSPADDGVYLLALQLWSTDAGIGNSETFYVVFNQNEDELVHEETLEYVEEAMVPGMKFEESMLVTGGANTWNVHGATPGNKVYFGYSLNLGVSQMPGCPGTFLSIKKAKVLGSATADANGEAAYSQFVPGKAAGLTVHFQAAEPATCTLSNWLSHTY